MPRKKVAPQDRVRAVKACKQCRRSKKKCDGRQPCANCVRRGLEAQCEIDEATESDRADARRISARQSVTSSSLNEDSGRHVGPPSNQASSYDTGSPEVSIRTNLRMLNSGVRGERVFIGEHASLSFLQLMRDVVRTSIGASEFSTGPRQDLMLQADLEDGLELDQYLLTNGHLEEWADAYMLATNGLIDLFDKSEISAMLVAVRSGDDSRDPLSTAITYLILAIGAQVAGDAQHVRQERTLFTLAIKTAFHDYLRDPGLMIAQAFLLASFYSFGACNRNAAYMYLGTATRAAQAVGLHSSTSYRSLPPDEYLKRSRLWKSLLALDVIACSILGRPQASVATRSSATEDADPFPPSTTQSQLATWSAYKLARTVEDISNELSGRRTLQIDLAEQQLEKLQAWSKALPENIRMKSPPATHTTQLHRETVGSLHVSCFYHFSMLLVTRPFLVPVLMKQTSVQQQDFFMSADTMTAADEARAVRLAHTCVNVAINMIETCWDVYSCGAMLQNMCIIKAWVFSAALVIGFHLFASNTEVDKEAESAFTNSLHILQYLAIRSPQAKHYHDILTYLRDAINQRRQQNAVPSRKQNAFTIDRLMTSGSSLSGDTAVVSSDAGGNYHDDIQLDSNLNGSTGEWLDHFPATDMEMQQFLHNPGMQENQAMLSFWDQFSFEP